MVKLATHNSGTGEPSKNWVHRLFTPFVKCQDKTIEEQLEAGVRYFDFRVNKDLMLCHGLWVSKTSLDKALQILNEYPEITYYRVVFERQNANHLIDLILQNTVHKYKRTRLVEVIEKKPVWNTRVVYRNIPIKKAFLSVPTFKEYITFSVKPLKRCIPIPRILNKFVKYELDDEKFTMIDFV